MALRINSKNKIINLNESGYWCVEMSNEMPCYIHMLNVYIFANISTLNLSARLAPFQCHRKNYKDSEDG